MSINHLENSVIRFDMTRFCELYYSAMKTFSSAGGEKWCSMDTWTDNDIPLANEFLLIYGFTTKGHP